MCTYIYKRWTPTRNQSQEVYGLTRYSHLMTWFKGTVSITVWSGPSFF